jgi:predicted DNA-binding transcriptional regulator YafY
MGASYSIRGASLLPSCALGAARCEDPLLSASSRAIMRAMPATLPPRPVKAPDSKAKKAGRPAGSFTQHRRIDQLLSVLEGHPRGLSLAELAAVLHVTERSMRRYLSEVKGRFDLISEPLVPGGANVWRINPASLPRKVDLRRTQAYALLAARRVFEPMRGSALFDEIDFAIQRLVSVARRPGRGPNAGVADARLEDRFLYLPFSPKNYHQKTEELDDLFQAVADLRPLSCRYKTGRDGDQTRIVIHPYAMVLYRDAIYCVGKHVAKDEIRTFLLDRMRETETATKERFELPKDFTVDDYFQGQFGIFRGKDEQRVVIDFDARVAELVRSRKVHHSQRLAALPHGGVRLSMVVGDLTEVTSWVLGYGETATVIEPPALRERVMGELRNALAQYEQGPRELPPKPKK